MQKPNFSSTHGGDAIGLQNLSEGNSGADELEMKLEELEIKFEEFEIILSDVSSNTSDEFKSTIEEDDVFCEGTIGKSEDIIE